MKNLKTTKKAQKNKLSSKTSKDSTSSQRIEGVWTALITPFKDDGSIDWKSFEALLEKQNKAQVNGIVISGTTGEAPTLSDEEKIALIRFARNILDGNIRLMAGTGSSCTKKSAELSLKCMESGADSLLVVTPPYNKGNPSGLHLHFEWIAKFTQAPICVYHVPGRTAHWLKAETMKSLLEIPNIISIKEASADLILFSKTKQLIQSLPERSILSGDDFTYLPSLSVGSHGIISVVTNIFPEAFVKLTKAFKAGRFNEAENIHNALFNLTELLFVETNPAPVKAALSIMKLCKNEFRLPLHSISTDNLKLIQKSLQLTQQNLAALN